MGVLSFKFYRWCLSHYLFECLKAPGGVVLWVVFKLAALRPSQVSDKSQLLWPCHSLCCHMVGVRVATNPTNELTCRCDPICSSTIGLEIQYNHVPFAQGKALFEGESTSERQRRASDVRERHSGTANPRNSEYRPARKAKWPKGLGLFRHQKKCHYAKHIEYPSLYVGANHLRLRVYRSYSSDIDLSNLAAGPAEKRFWMEEVDEKDFPLRVRSPR